MFLLSLNKHRKIINKILWLLGLCPGVFIASRYINNNMTENPFEFLIQHTAHWAMVFFILSYAITPIRRWLRFYASLRKWTYGKRLSDWNFLIYNRRLIGLCSFYYGTSHLFIYLYFELDFDWSEFYLETTERFFITLGLIGWLLLLLLAVTSPDFIQKLLKKNWRRIHKLVYLAVPIILGHSILEAKIIHWYLWVYLILLAIFSLHRIAVNYLPSMQKIAGNGMIAVRKNR
jgi:sulfoxide reductase heme-binding subunit YedZ